MFSQMSRIPSFLLLNTIHVCVHHTLFIHSFISERLTLEMFPFHPNRCDVIPRYDSDLHVCDD